MSIQEKIDKHIESEEVKRGVIVLNGESGSFTVPEGGRIILRDCSDVTCDGCEGRGELTIINGSNVTISDFKDGIIRLDKCDQITELTTSENTRINVSGGKIEKLDITKTQALFIDCEFEDAKMDNCDVTSKKNKHQKIAVTGGALFSEDDEFQGEASFEEGCVAHLIAAKFSDKLTADTASLNLVKGSFEGEVEFTDSKVVDTEGEYQDKLTVSGDKSHTILRESKLQKEFMHSDGVLVANALESEKEITIEKGSISAKGLKAQKDLTLTDCDVILTGAELNGTTTISSCASRLVDCKFEDDVTFEEGAIDSERCTYKQVIMTGGTIESVLDEFEKFEGTGLIAQSKFFKPKQIQEFKATGEDSSASLDLTGGEPQTMEIEDFGFVRMLKTDAQDLTCTKIATAFLTDCTTQTATFDECGTVVLDKGTADDATFTKCGQVLAATCEVSKISLDEVNCSSTSNVGDMTATKTTCIDSGSTIDGTDCTLITTGSTSTASASIVTASGGTVDASGSTVVLAAGADVTNEDCLTVGHGFNADLNAGCVLYDGDLTAQASIGNLKLISLEGTVQVDAALDIISTAGVAIIGTAGTEMINTAGTDITNQAAGSITEDAGADIVINAVNAVSTAAETIVLAASAEVAIGAGDVTIVGNTQMN